MLQACIKCDYKKFQEFDSSHSMNGNSSHLIKECNSFNLMRRNLDQLHVKNFLDYECESCLQQPLTPPQCRIINSYRTQIIHWPLKMNGSQPSQSLGIKIDANHVPKMQLENEARIVLECPLYNIPSLFQNAILDSLKSFFQLEHQVDISLYLVEPLHSVTLKNNLFNTILMYNTSTTIL